MREHDWVRWAGAAVFAALVAGCYVRGAYGPAYYDTGRCQWTWVQDGYGGYQQLACWNPYYNGWRPYYDGGHVRVYPHWYQGPRVRVAAPPPSFRVAPPAMPAMPGRPIAPPAMPAR